MSECLCAADGSVNGENLKQVLNYFVHQLRQPESEAAGEENRPSKAGKPNQVGIRAGSHSSANKLNLLNLDLN